MVAMETRKQRAGWICPEMPEPPQEVCAEPERAGTSNQPYNRLRAVSYDTDNAEQAHRRPSCSLVRRGPRLDGRRDRESETNAEVREPTSWPSIWWVRKLYGMKEDIKRSEIRHNLICNIAEPLTLALISREQRTH